VLKTWLDVEVEHPETADLSLALVSPGNKRYEVSGEGGANLHQLLGLQSNAAILSAFESERVGGTWRLEVTNRSQTATAKLMRAVLMLETRSATSPPSIESFDFDESSVVADGQELQTLRMRLANASAVGEIRLLVNRPDHSENGRSYDGYIRMDPSQCVELGSGFGNDRISLDETSCSWSQSDAGLDVAVSLAFESDFGAASNNQVSVLLLDEDNAQLSAWTRASATGSGFAVTAGPAQPPASFGSFHFGAPTVLGNGADVQSLNLSINSGAQIDSVRFMINHPSHAQGNLLQRGYFLASREGCHEVTSRYGNDVVTLIEGGCSVETQEDGSVRIVVPFAVEPDFGVSVNNQVSAIWYAGGVQQVGWRRVSEPDLGFSVQMTNIEAALAFDQPTIVANGVQLQTLRLTLTEAAQVDDLRLMINHPVHAENDNAPGGYFQFTDEGCREFTRQYGNPVVELRQDLCKRREVSPGVFEYVLRMTFGPSFAPSTNNQVSALWFENGVPRVGWRRLTPREEGFDVVGVDGPVEVESFTVEESQLRSDGLEVQTFRLLLTNAASVDAVEMMINRPGHSVNGRENDGHFLVSAQGCEQLTGQGTVTLLHDACGLRRHFDSTVEFSVSLVVEEAYGASDQNTVSGMWAGGDWSEMTAGDGRFDVVSP
jgi:subtilisin-like proprotein convertase family protein